MGMAAPDNKHLLEKLNEVFAVLRECNPDAARDWLDLQTKSTKEYRQSTLLRLMQQLARQHYSVSWRKDLEYYLWYAIEHPDKPLLGLDEDHPQRLAPDTIAALATLAIQANGWWCWDDDSGDTEFYPLVTLFRLYKVWNQKQGKKAMAAAMRDNIVRTTSSPGMAAMVFKDEPKGGDWDEPEDAP